MFFVRITESLPRRPWLSENCWRNTASGYNRLWNSRLRIHDKKFILTEAEMAINVAR